MSTATKKPDELIGRRYFADGKEVLRHGCKRYVTCFVATCRAPSAARNLAAALNREELLHTEVANARAALAAGLDEVDALRAALARLADACGSSSWARISPALEKARRVLGQREFTPGGEEVGRD